MFEVKGWKLSAPLKADTSVAEKRRFASDQDAPDQQTKSKKRKRGHEGRNGTKITAENLGEVWQEHIEGKPTRAQKHGSKPEATKSKNVRKSGSVSKTKSQARSNGVISKKPEDDPLQEDKPQSQHRVKQKARHASAENASPKPSNNTPDLSSAASIATPVSSKLTALQSKMSHKLASARFRHLNQQLYTTPSNDALSLFTTNPDMFKDYHAGFAQQVDVWPENPVDSYVSDILERGKVRGPPAGTKGKPRNEGPRGVKSSGLEPLPRIRDRSFQCVIADLGCGTAKLSTSLQPQLKKLNLKIHSFDLHSPSPLVTAADIANLPLPDSSIDVAIACLALMGTNWIDFIEEAWRVLRWKGELWVAEIKSRFSRSTAASGTGPAHSISKRQQKKQGLVGKVAAKKDQARQEKDHQEQLEVEVDGVDPAAGSKGETDVAHFVKVLERRGFALEGDADLSNKMFVKMRFVKAASPLRAKHVRAENTVKAKKFVDKPDEKEFDEQAVLKPCVYKLR